ncbi:unannotated protein [freshwater metagenome]|uniref:Unannotated protein n=1 Tax=freshwater metagenome TaxID=449393 RepID=A0A6J6QWC9_9ZZZZ
MRSASEESTPRTQSAKIARPVALVLRVPSPPAGKQTPSGVLESGFTGTTAEYLFGWRVIVRPNAAEFVCDLEGDVDVRHRCSEIGKAGPEPNLSIDSCW